MTLVSGGHREVRFWDMATGVPPLALTESENLKLAYAGALALTATGKQLAVGTRRDIALWWTRGGFEEGPKAVDAGLNIPKENLSIWDIECARGVGLNLAKAELELKVRIGR